MTRTHVNESLDDYMDGMLDDAEKLTLDEHLRSCDACRRVVESERRLRTLLKDHPVPAADATFFEQALAKATHVGTSRQRNRWIMTGFGGAIAAGLIAWFVGGALIQSPTNPAATISGVTMALEEPRTVNLVFSSATKLDNAILTVSLPPGIEVEGFTGQQEITWMTSLQAGKNILPLKLIATTTHGGELLATLEHENRDRTFRIRVTVT
jgi:hypothetical protein